MKLGFFFVLLVLVLQSCRRECDCQDLCAEYSQTVQVDLPKSANTELGNEHEMIISIDENNIIKLDSQEKTIAQIDSSIINLIKEGHQPLIKLSADKKSNFSTFNDVLVVSQAHELKLVITQQ